MKDNFHQFDIVNESENFLHKYSQDDWDTLLPEQLMRRIDKNFSNQTNKPFVLILEVEDHKMNH